MVCSMALGSLLTNMIPRNENRLMIMMMMRNIYDALIYLLRFFIVSRKIKVIK